LTGDGPHPYTIFQDNPRDQTMRNLKFVGWLPLLIAGLAALTHADAPITAEQQAAFTPQVVLDELMAGNARFVSGQSTERDLTARIVQSAAGQSPKAVILSCLDSRVPVEKVFDVSIGDIFVGRNAGNVSNADQLGSIEFATAVAGAKLVMVLGHTSCGAVAGAIAGAELGNLTQLLSKIRPAVNAVEGYLAEERTSDNSDFVNAVADRNVAQTITRIRTDSSVLAELENNGDILIVGAGYDLQTGRVILLQ